MQLPIHIDRTLRRSFQRQIGLQLRALIERGYLAPGDRMPSTRALAADLGVARRTVSNVYDELGADGLLSASPRGGTVVIGGPDAATSGSLPAGPDLSPRRDIESRWSSAVIAQTGLGLYIPPQRQFRYDFRLGRPDAASFPVRTWRTLMLEQLEVSARLWADYTDPAGHPGLREAICRALLPGRGVVCAPEDVIIVGGTQDGLNLLGRLFRLPEFPVAVETPCYEGAALALQSLGARLLPCSLDEDGISMEELSRSPARMVYVTPSHQFPMGMTMSHQRRRELVAWSDMRASVIIEDDYDSDVQYEHSIPALKSLSPETVVYIGSFSKSIGPGIRLGYLVLPRHLSRAARALKSLMSNGQPWFEQGVLADFISRGFFDRHRRHMKSEYRLRRDVLIEALEHAFPGSSFSGVGAGMHLAWNLPANLGDAERLRVTCAAADVGVYTLSGSPFFSLRPTREQASRVFLGYAGLSQGKIGAGVSRIQLAIAARGLPPDYTRQLL